MERIDKTNVDEILKELDEKGLVIPIIYDPIFKNIFKDPEMKGILSYLISTITGYDEDFVYKNLRFKDSNIGKKHMRLKDNTADLIVDFGRSIVMLEMNKENDKHTRFRNLTHFHNEVVSTILVSSTIDNITEVIQISFDNKRPFSDHLVSRVMMRDDNNQIDFDEMGFIKYRVNLSFLNKKEYNISELTRFEKILLMMREESKERLSLLAGKDKELINMVKKVENMSSTRKYVTVISEEHINKVIEETKRQDALKEGREKGIKEGIKEGIETGSKKKSFDIAKNMLKEGLDIDLVVKVTGLSKKEIEALK